MPKITVYYITKKLLSLVQHYLTLNYTIIVLINIKYCNILCTNYKTYKKPYCQLCYRSVGGRPVVV